MTSGFIKRLMHFSTSLCYILTLSMITSMVNGQGRFQTEADSLIKLLQQTTNPIEKIDLLNAISYAHRRISTDKVIEYANQAYFLSRDYKYKKGEVLANKNLGIGYIKKDVPRDTVIAFFETASRLAGEIDDYQTQAACLNNIALVLGIDGSYQESNEYLLKSLGIVNQYQFEDFRLESIILGNLGLNYLDLKEYEKANQYLKECIELATKGNHDYILGIYLDDYGRSFLHLNEWSEAEKNIDRGLKVQKNMGDYESIIRSLNTKMNLFIQQKKYNEAEQLGLNAVQLANDKGFPLSLAMCFSNLTKVAFHQKHYKNTIDYGETTLKNTKSANQLPFEKEALGWMAKAYAALGDHQRAFETNLAYIKVSDSLRNEAKEKYAAHLETTYQNKKQEQQITYLNTQHKSQDTRIQLLIGLALITFLSIGFIMFLWFKSKEANKIIEEKNQQLEEYIESNMHLENFAHITSHDLKTPLRTIVSFSQLLKRKSKNKLNDTEQEYLDFVIKGTKDMSHLIDNLKNLSQVQSEQLKLEEVELNPLFEDLILSLDTVIKEHSAEVSFASDVSSIQCDKIKIKQLLQNLIINGIKFQQPDQFPIVKINVEERDENWEFSIADNGIGIDEDKQSNIFNTFNQSQSQSQNGNGQYHAGIGLAICKKITEQHNGKIWVNSKLGKGSTFYFTINK